MPEGGGFVLLYSRDEGTEARRHEVRGKRRGFVPHISFWGSAVGGFGGGWDWLAVMGGAGGAWVGFWWARLTGWGWGWDFEC